MKNAVGTFGRVRRVWNRRSIYDTGKYQPTDTFALDSSEEKKILKIEIQSKRPTLLVLLAQYLHLLPETRMNPSIVCLLRHELAYSLGQRKQTLLINGGKKNV